MRDRLLAGEELSGILGPVTVRSWAKRWLEMRAGLIENHECDESALRLHVLPHIGDVEIGEVRPRHVAGLVRTWCGAQYAPPRTIRNVHYVMKSMFRDAAVEGLIDTTPCILGRAQLPKIADADPEWRAAARYTREELEALVSDPRLPLHERVANAMLAWLVCGSASTPGCGSGPCRSTRG